MGWEVGGKFELSFRSQLIPHCPASMLVLMLASFSIMDAILDGPRDEPAFVKARKIILSKLSGQWAMLAVDRVGTHIVKKLFRGLTDWEDKAILTAELVQYLNRLGGNAMGRSVVDACAVKEFMEGEDAWKAAIRKIQQREEFVEDILAAGSTIKDGDHKKKRKRKKHGKEKAADDDHTVRQKKSRKTNVESIVNVISVKTKELT